MTGGPLLIAYDGSERAHCAIRWAAELFPGRQAVVLHVHEAVDPALLAPMAGAALATRELEQATLGVAAERRHADDVADRGRREAQQAGLEATAETLHAHGGAATAEAITSAAVDHHAAAIVLGCHGRSAIASAILGSVSTAVLHRAKVPVLLVPGRCAGE